MAWVEEAGLILDIVGAVVLASGLIISRQRAIELGVSLYAGERGDENLGLPQAETDSSNHAMRRSALPSSSSVSFASSSATCPTSR